MVASSVKELFISSFAVFASFNYLGKTQRLGL
jgi:hypothetical protein